MRFKFHSSFLWSDNRHNNHTWSLETPTGHVLIPGVKHNTQSSHEWLVRAQCVCSAPGVTGALPGLRSMLASDIHLKNDGHIYITMWCHCPCSAFFCLQLPFCEAVVIVSNCSMTTYALQFFNDLSTAPPRREIDSLPLSECTYPLLNCSRQQSTGLHSGQGQSCHCPGHWWCVERKRASWGWMWLEYLPGGWSLFGAKEEKEVWS